MNETPVETRYKELFGYIPDGVRMRIDLARMAGRETALEAIEHLRDTLIHHNPLERKTQQLVHLGMLLVLGREAPALLHARAAIQAGADAPELHGVCETAAIVGGMPAYNLGIQVVSQALRESTGDNANE
ncbi:carboxymuconolactone decarboxylase family protein [Acidithiobacillus ferridurans]|uniref:carboxymuconolactone decarboxylase family protein n=1 Tax=Acidithiobacillus ferridurans TaxID=1232575 RepID=UPI001C0771D2|nr:carboxymuconolactone decarboxylase family protein [Acidithiobacillus ferridurans]MBU2718570.1 carboxymuconolactone decarboxylase family protein [Acidithiobacillus ferridurans]MBU2803928.1 carboxymuconolactone decarboxylase family protein [Acidithiobacillus ferridurans]